MAYWWENNKIYPVVPASSDPGGEVWLEVSEPATLIKKKIKFS
jgi:hypothetical protein